ncbi:DEAD/DEAH box helicase [Arcobacter sp. LA11]|uniref:DEAD/DEAH box helicase n=1 Tax=Arcobacter sp. LA11 TaxID=1898176 RepID=UPI000934EEF7|nr:DEAD/DEAH box helicase [Arcobacter sp. LA11]
MSFSSFKFCKPLLKSLSENSYTEATPIQKEVIPLVLEENDIMAKAQTGSGKTASFVLPILQKLFSTITNKKSKPKVLVLSPTRELTLQISNNFKIFSKHFEKSLKIVSVVGGLSIADQLLDIQKGCDVIVATTGRLIDIINKKQLNLDSLEYFILDEADKMLDLGFADELDTILKLLPKRRQNLLFSATYPFKMIEISKVISSSFVKVEMEEQEENLDNITQRVIEVNKENRSALLKKLIETNKFEKILVFMSTKRATDNIAKKFRKSGFKADSFHGDLIQEDRTFTLDEFKNDDLQILFSTDIAARGLHVDDISCVVNYDLPRSAFDYVHRIGRTGRAGKIGTSITFIDYENLEHFKLIEKKCKLNIKKEQIEGFELIGEPIKKVKGSAPIKGKRKSKKDKLREKQNNIK